MNATRLSRLMAFLDRDPHNVNLLTEAANVAFEGGEFDLVEQLLGRLAELGDLAPSQRNLRALIALSQQDFQAAATQLEQLRATHEDSASLRFNLSWAYMMLERYEEASEILDDDAIAASRHGPKLKVQALHHLERYDEALAIGEQLARAYPDDSALMGALATLSMDASRIDLAEAYAARAGNSAEGLSAQGLLALDAQDADGAIALFDQSIEAAPDNARSWVGKGLALLGSGRIADAGPALEKGALLFEDHLGSWVATGWAHFIAGDEKQARSAFDRVVAIDATFAEGYGGLAVLDLVEGNIESAERNSKVALRLDRASFGGALAQTMLLDLAGDGASAQRIRAAALSAPIGPRGQTLSQALSAMGSQVLRS